MQVDDIDRTVNDLEAAVRALDKYSERIGKCCTVVLNCGSYLAIRHGFSTWLILSSPSPVRFAPLQLFKSVKFTNRRQVLFHQQLLLFTNKGTDARTFNEEFPAQVR